MSIDEKAAAIAHEKVPNQKLTDIMLEWLEAYEAAKLSEQPVERTAFERWWRNQFAFSYTGDLSAPDTTFYGAKKEHVEYIWREGRKSATPMREVEKPDERSVERVAKDIATDVLRGSRWRDYIPHAKAALRSIPERESGELERHRDSIRCMSAFLDDCAAELGTPKGDPDAMGDEIISLKEAKTELYGIVYGMLDLHESEDIMGMDFKNTATLLMDRARVAVRKYGQAVTTQIEGEQL